MTAMDDRHIAKAKKLVLERYPEMAGAEPSVSKKRSQSKGLAPRSSRSGGSERRGHYLLTFEKDVSLPGGHRMKRLVRVTMDESGEVIKLTSSK